jgi:hypothetical protein
MNLPVEKSSKMQRQHEQSTSPEMATHSGDNRGSTSSSSLEPECHDKKEPNKLVKKKKKYQEGLQTFLLGDDTKGTYLIGKKTQRSPSSKSPR